MQKNMVVGSYTILPSLPMLEVAHNIASTRLWCFCPKPFGGEEDGFKSLTSAHLWSFSPKSFDVNANLKVEYEVWRGPKKPWPPMATQITFSPNVGSGQLRQF